MAESVKSNPPFGLVVLNRYYLSNLPFKFVVLSRRCLNPVCLFKGDQNGRLLRSDPRRPGLQISRPGLPHLDRNVLCLVSECKQLVFIFHLSSHVFVHFDIFFQPHIIINSSNSHWCSSPSLLAFTLCQPSAWLQLLQRLLSTRTFTLSLQPRRKMMSPSLLMCLPRAPKPPRSPRPLRTWWSPFPRTLCFQPPLRQFGISYSSTNILLHCLTSSDIY